MKARLGVLLLFIFTCESVLAQQAEQCENFFAGRNVRFVVATGAGGGYDNIARTFARLFSDTTAARSHVSNLPGGHGRIAFAAIVEADDSSLTIGLLGREGAIVPTINNPGTPINDLHILGIVAIEDVAWVARDDYGLNIDSTGRIPVASVSSYEAAVRWGLPALSLGIEVAAVLGYSGSSESVAALLRGDVDLGAYSLSRTNRLLLRGGVKPVLILADRNNPAFPEVPYLAGSGGLIDGLTTDLSTARRESLMAQAIAAAELSKSVRVLVGSHNIGPQTLQCLKGAIDQVLLSEEMAASMNSMRQTFTPISSAQAAARLQRDLQMVEDYREAITQAEIETLR